MNKIIEFLPEMVEKKLDGAVFYVDGGMRPINGKNKATYGIHGYFFSSEPTTKHFGAKDFLPTPEGYTLKKDTLPQDKCTVIAYYETYGQSPGGTNNTGEMDALIVALRTILADDMIKHLKTCYIWSDSEGTVKGANLWMKGWIKNGWRNSQGNPVANKERWLIIKELLEEVAKHKVKLMFQWIRGHVGNHGNELADYQASKAIFSNIDTDEAITLPENMYVSETGHTRLLLDSKMYHRYNVIPTVDERAQYLTFSHPSSNYDVGEDVGRASRDVGIGLVRVHQRDAIVDKVIEACEYINETHVECPIIIHLQTILKPGIEDQIEGGLLKNFRIDSENHVKSLKKEVLLTVVNPPRLSYRLYDEYEEAANILDYYEKNSDLIRYTDITDLFFEKAPTKKDPDKLKFVLTSEKSLDVKATFPGEEKDREGTVTITFGIDTPQRRMFNGIATMNPKIGVITWEESENVYRFGLIVTCDEGTGIWYGPYCNTQRI